VLLSFFPFVFSPQQHLDLKKSKFGRTDFLWHCKAVHDIPALSAAHLLGEPKAFLAMLCIFSEKNSGSARLANFCLGLIG
jgi:hypothetical protein